MLPCAFPAGKCFPACSCFPIALRIGTSAGSCFPMLPKRLPLEHLPRSSFRTAATRGAVTSSAQTSASLHPPAALRLRVLPFTRAWTPTVCAEEFPTPLEMSLHGLHMSTGLLMLKQTQIYRPICTDCLRHLRISARWGCLLAGDAGVACRMKLLLGQGAGVACRMRLLPGQVRRSCKSPRARILVLGTSGAHWPARWPQFVLTERVDKS